MKLKPAEKRRLRQERDQLRAANHLDRSHVIPWREGSPAWQIGTSRIQKRNDRIREINNMGV